MATASIGPALTTHITIGSTISKRLPPTYRPTLFLFYCPTPLYRHAAHAGFDLLLSGYTHGGQVCLPGSIQRQIRHPALRWMATLDCRVDATGAVFEGKFMLPWSFSEGAAAEKYSPSSSTICLLLQLEARFSR